MKPYATDVRIRVVQADENGEGSMRQLAIRFRVSLSCVRRRLTHSRDTGRVAPQPDGGGAPANIEASGLEGVQALVPGAPDAPRRALCRRCAEPYQGRVRMATMSRVLAPRQLTRKKHLSRHGTSARGGAEPAGRLPRGEARA
jgi:transposase